MTPVNWTIRIKTSLGHIGINAETGNGGVLIGSYWILRNTLGAFRAAVALGLLQCVVHVSVFKLPQICQTDVHGM